MSVAELKNRYPNILDLLSKTVLNKDYSLTDRELIQLGRILHSEAFNDLYEYVNVAVEEITNNPSNKKPSSSVDRLLTLPINQWDSQDYNFYYNNKQTIDSLHPSIARKIEEEE